MESWVRDFEQRIYETFKKKITYRGKELYSLLCSFSKVEIYLLKTNMNSNSKGITLSSPAIELNHEFITFLLFYVLKHWILRFTKQWVIEIIRFREVNNIFYLFS